MKRAARLADQASGIRQRSAPRHPPSPLWLGYVR
jgi:hypothetical protein